MESFILSLFIVPIISSILVLITTKALGRVITITTAIFVSVVSVFLFFNLHETISIQLPGFFDSIVIFLDFLLLIYFGYVAITRRNVLVGIMTILQMGALLYFISKSPHNIEESQFMINRLSLFMYLLINIISGIIATYALKYIDEEQCTEYRKKFFLSTILWFISVMNMIVSADNLDYFFLLFELTTLASFLLIGFRKDEISVNSALNALWMNQIGGLAILGAMIYLALTPGNESITFSGLIEGSKKLGVLLPFALLAVAALIKGAQMPFSGWLLGAMVAPTPVSALLHSSTMVKIAPYVILRISPAIHGTALSWVIIGLTAFVFLAGAISALSQDTFKRILAYSTISLLGLMCLMAAVGSEIAIMASLILIIFHGISKCMLFLDAGIMEHVFHYKKVTEMDKLGDTGPLTALIAAIGFMSLLLPPFGAFIGKWFTLETLGITMHEYNIFGALVIVFIALGGAIMALLYFKVIGNLIIRNGENEIVKWEKLHPIYNSTMYLLMFFVFAGIVLLPWLLINIFIPVTSYLSNTSIDFSWVGTTLKISNFNFPVLTMALAFLLFPITIIIAMLIRFKSVDRVKEYTCGENINYRFSSFYFSTDKANPYFIVIGGIFFICLIAVGGII